MKKVIIFLVLVVNLFFPSTAKAYLEFNPILPFQGIVGVKSDYYLEDFQPYAALGYGLETEDIHYQLGSQYQINPQFSLDLKYNNWSSYILPAYIAEEGFKVDLDYDRTESENLDLAFFTGEIKDQEEEIATIYFNSNYQKELYYSWDKEVQLHLDIITGKVNETDDVYYTSNLKLPIMLGEYTIIPQLGYIKSSDKIKPYYQLDDYLIGHSQQKEGTKLVNLSLARSFDLFSQSGIWGIEMLDLITVVNFGDIMAENEGLDDFDLNATAGVGLSYKIVGADFRYKHVIDNHGEYGFEFNITQDY